MPRSLIPVMAPHGSLRLDQADDDFVLESGLADRLEKSFERGSGHGLLHLGAGEAGSVLPPSLAWWRDFGMRFIADVFANVIESVAEIFIECFVPGFEALELALPLTPDDLAELRLTTS